MSSFGLGWSTKLFAWAEKNYTYTSVRNSGNLIQTLPTVVRTPLGKKEIQKSQGVYVGEDVQIITDQAYFPFTPKTADSISSPTGPSLVVLSVKAVPLSQFYELICRDLVIVYDLQQLATINRPNVASTAGGLRNVTGYTALATNAPCRLQSIDVTVESDTLGGSVSRRRFNLYMATDIDVLVGDVVVVNSVSYEIKEHPMVNFDTLATIVVERIEG